MSYFPALSQRFLRPLFFCGVLFFLASCSSKVELTAALPEAEANEVLAVLLNAGIKADKIPGKEGNVSLEVEKSQVARAIDLLHDQGLPRERFAGMGDVFKKEGLISSPLEERARYIYALSQELSNTLSRIDGVLTARVHVVLPERASGGDPTQPASAAVFIKYQEGANIDIVQPQIKRLVTNSIPSLSPEKVSIILVSAQPGLLLRPTKGNAFSNVMGFQVAGNSSTPLLITLMVLILLLLLSLAALGWLGWKNIFPDLKIKKFSSKAGTPPVSNVSSSGNGGNNNRMQTSATAPEAISAIAAAPKTTTDSDSDEA